VNNPKNHARQPSEKQWAGLHDYVSKLENGYDIAVVSRRAIQCVLPNHKGVGKSKHDNNGLFELRR